MNSIHPQHAALLGELYAELFAITPLGWLPYVTLGYTERTRYCCVIADQDGALRTGASGASVGEVLAIVRPRLPAGRGEVRA